MTIDPFRTSQDIELDAASLCEALHTHNHGMADLAEQRYVPSLLSPPEGTKPSGACTHITIGSEELPHSA
jgi:hypothetical protein